MTKVRIGVKDSTNVSWRDEINYISDIESKGFKKLKKAIKMAKLLLETDSKQLRQP